MDITIKIPKEFEKDFLGLYLPGIDKGGFSDFFERVKADLKGNMVLCGNYELETLEMLKKAFMDAKTEMENNKTAAPDTRNDIADDSDQVNLEEMVDYYENGEKVSFKKTTASTHKTEDYYAELEKKHFGDPDSKTGIYDTAFDSPKCVTMINENEEAQEIPSFHRRKR